MSTATSSLDEYHRLRESFRLEVPEFYNFGCDVVDKWAGQRPDHLAMLWVGPDGERWITFSEMAARSNQVANALTGLGLERGEQVLVMLPSLPEWWEALTGLCKADLIAIPGTSLLMPEDIVYRVESAEVDAIITDETGADKVEQVAGRLPGLRHQIQVGTALREGWLSYDELVGGAPEEWTPLQTRSDGPALIYFTSGTTGLPKMVLHTHASYGLGHDLTGRFWLGLTPDDLHWNISDPGWAKTAYCGLFGPWIQGASVFLRHLPGKFEPADALVQLTEHRITSFCGAPTIYRMLVQEDLAGFAPKALRQCMAAGEPLNPAVLEKWKDVTGLTIREGYGQTETVILCASMPGMAIKPGSMGLPPPGIDLAVVDGDGQALPPGEEGEIAVRVHPERPVGLFKEYWHNPDATAKCYRKEWYLTGDCARVDESGYFWFVARADDIITSSAYRIGPFEVENALMKHPAVAEVAVIGKPDAVRTEIVKAIVVLAKGYAPSDDMKVELQSHTKRTTAPYKYPREIEFVEELPKTISGKIRRVELREGGNP